MKWRLVPQFGGDVKNDKRYRVETVELLTLDEALALKRELGDPYPGQYFSNLDPTRSVDS